MLSIVERMGIKIVPVIPTLVRLTSNQPAITESQGISLNDVKFSIYLKNKKIAELSDSIVFTHNGISGPGAINSSSFITDKPLSEIKVTIDFLPAISFDNFIEIHGDLENDYQNIKFDVSISHDNEYAIATVIIF